MMNKKYICQICGFESKPRDSDMILIGEHESIGGRKAFIAHNDGPDYIIKSTCAKCGRTLYCNIDGEEVDIYEKTT